MILNERHIRRLIKEAINNLMEADEIDADTGLPVSSDGGAAARSAKADATSQAAKSKMFQDVVDFSRVLRLTVATINDITRKVATEQDIDGNFDSLAKLQGDKEKITRISGSILYYLYTLNGDIRTFDILGEFSKDDAEIKALQKLRTVIIPIIALAERADNPATIAAYVDRLEKLKADYPDVSRGIGADAALSRARLQTAAGLEEGIESDIEAMMSGVIATSSMLANFAPNSMTLRRAAKTLQGVKDGRVALSVGSTGPAVEVMQRLMVMVLTKMSRSVTRYNRPFASTLNAGAFAAMAYDAADNLVEDGFDGKFGKNTKDAVEVIQKVMLARQKGTQGVLKDGTYTYKIENPAAVDGVIGSQTLGAIVNGDFDRKASSIASKANDSDRVAGGSERGEVQAVDVGDMKREVLEVFDDVALESTGESPDQVAQYKVGMRTILDKGDFEKYRARGLNSRQVATSIMTDFNFPDELVGAPGLVDALADYIDAI